MNIIAPIIVGLLYVSLCSLFKEPNRRHFNTVMIAGAGAAYLSGGFGIWEFVFTAAVTFCAYKGLILTDISAQAGCCIPFGTRCTIFTATR